MINAGVVACSLVFVDVLTQFDVCRATVVCVVILQRPDGGFAWFNQGDHGGSLCVTVLFCVWLEHTVLRL